MAAVALHAAVRLHVKDRAEKMLVNAFVMGPGKVLAPTTRTRETSRTGKNVPHP